MSYYTNILLANFNRFIPNKKKSYVTIIKNTYEEKKSALATTLLLNIVAFIITGVIDLMVYLFNVSYLNAIFIHLGLIFYYVLHFNMYRNNMIFLFAYIFMIISLFIFKYWLLTFIFILVGSFYLLHEIYSFK